MRHYARRQEHQGLGRRGRQEARATAASSSPWTLNGGERRPGRRHPRRRRRQHLGGAGWVGAGYDGVQVFAPDGERIGLILLPEICANVCFGGPQRNRLFMAASQSLYAVYVETQGAHIC